MTKYELWYTSDTGQRLRQLTPLEASFSKTINAIGGMSMQLPVTFPLDLLGRDRLVQVWRDGALFSVYFVRRWIVSNAGQSRTLVIYGRDANDLLRRRNVIAYSGEAGATASNEAADDLMKRLVTSSISDGVTPTPSLGYTRQLPRLSVQGNATQGPQVSLSFPFKKLLTSSGGGVLSQIADRARAARTEVFFSIVPFVVTGSNITFQFRTAINQPGSDLRNNGIVFSLDNRNLSEPSLEFDYEEEYSYVWAAGQGQTTDRDVREAVATDRINASIWAYSETVKDARQQSPGDETESVAEAELVASAPRIAFSGVPLSVAGSRFGVDWNWGDRVRVRYLGYNFDAFIDTVALQIAPGRETIAARLEYESTNQ